MTLALIFRAARKRDRLTRPRWGQFQLMELPGGRTRLEGTTWYRNAIWPSAYWRVWSDYIIHRIHMRVLEHIKTEAEGQLVLNGDRKR